MNDYGQHDATGLAQLVAHGEVSAAELLECAIARCEVVNPHINAVIQPMYEQARAAVQTTLPSGPFAGVPFLLKDLLAAYAGVPLSYGNRRLKSYVPTEDAEIVRRFKSSGAVIFGKTNTPEFGLVGFTEPEAWGATRNPWSLEHSTGGSSGGAAAAVATGIVPMAHGGDGGGSIRIPASNCGLFGLKPSRGRVPLGPGTAEAWQGAVQEGLISRSVRDSAAMLDWIAGPDVGAPYGIAPPAQSFAMACQQAPAPLRIGFIRTGLGGPLHEDCKAAVESAGKLLTDLGHHVEEVALPYDHDLMVDCYLTMYYAETASELRWLGKFLGRRAKRSDVELETWLLAHMGEALSAAEAAMAKRQWNTLARSMGRFHQQYDLLLTPTLGTPPVRIGELKAPPALRAFLKSVDMLGGIRLLRRAIHDEAQRNFARMPFTQIANLTGQPAMSVPLHWNAAGLPIGVQFIAPLNGEERLFALAGQLEAAQPWAQRRAVL
jgi:amidase